ncbi:hypothetical protein [Haloglycomyces albus]|uniref:hypothetical protein n=1 Tax=Haloglycomyces albus TaxID=526067 RepID=UPI00046D292E|nr:hypothetical protein [Haloglycomyces albus]
MIRAEDDHLWSDSDPDLIIRHTPDGWHLPWTDGHCVPTLDKAQWAGTIAESTTSQLRLTEAAGLCGVPIWQLRRLITLNFTPEISIDSGADTDTDHDTVPREWAADIASRISQLIPKAGTIPDVGLYRAAAELSERLGLTVTTDGVEELVRRGYLHTAGTYEHRQLYSGLDIEVLTDTAIVAAACAEGRLIDANEAASYLDIRQSDWTHLVRAGLVTPIRSQRYWNARYRAADLDALETNHPDIDWDAVRSTAKGRRSLLAGLPTATA